MRLCTAIAVVMVAMSCNHILPPAHAIPPQVPFSACLERWAAEEVVEGVHSAVLGRKAPASKTTRFATFPPYLAVVLK